MLIFEEGFEGCSLGFTQSARWAAVGTAQLDDTVADDTGGRCVARRDD